MEQQASKDDGFLIPMAHAKLLGLPDKKSTKKAPSFRTFAFGKKKFNQSGPEFYISCYGEA